MPSAIVTGGAIRLGRAMALRLAQRGYDLALHYNTSTTEAEQAAAEAQALGVRCRLYPCNLSRPEEAENLIKKVVADQKPSIPVPGHGLF